MVNIALLKIFADELKLLLVFISGQLLLLVDYQGISVFKSILRSAFEVLSDLRPLFVSLVFPYTFEEVDIFVGLPGSFFELRAEVAGPVLSALLCISIDLLLIIVEQIKLLRNLLPIFDF